MGINPGTFYLIYNVDGHSFYTHFIVLYLIQYNNLKYENAIAGPMEYYFLLSTSEI